MLLNMLTEMSKTDQDRSLLQQEARTGEKRIEPKKPRAGSSKELGASEF